MTDSRSEIPLLVVFTNITRATYYVQKTTDLAAAELCDAYYKRLGEAVDAAGGTLVKFIGDGCLFVFPETGVDRGIRMLLDLKPNVDALLLQHGWTESRMQAKVHFGTVVAGPFGAAGAKRFDVIGKAVNTAARLESSGVTLSAAAFRKLNPEMRKQFRKSSPPITYIRMNEDSPRPGHGGLP